MAKLATTEGMVERKSFFKLKYLLLSSLCSISGEEPFIRQSMRRPGVLQSVILFLKYRYWYAYSSVLTRATTSAFNSRLFSLKVVGYARSVGSSLVLRYQSCLLLELF
jgi:hypothetical protein